MTEHSHKASCSAIYREECACGADRWLRPLGDSRFKWGEWSAPAPSHACEAMVSATDTIDSLRAERDSLKAERDVQAATAAANARRIDEDEIELRALRARCEALEGALREADDDRGSLIGWCNRLPDVPHAWASAAKVNSYVDQMRAWANASDAVRHDVNMHNGVGNKARAALATEGKPQ